MNCLLISKKSNETVHDIEHFLFDHRIGYETVNDPYSGLQRAQEQHFDLIILDTGSQNTSINQAIRLLKGCDPQTRIIVQTDSNSRALESAIRKEKVYYFHINSFGLKDLTIAIQSALRLNGIIES